MNAIYGYAQLLERSAEDGGRDSVQAGKVIRRSAEHLSNLVEGLLDIAQVESGSLKLARDTIRFPAFLEQITAMFEPQAAMKGLALRLELPPTLPEYVRTDPKRLRQVLLDVTSKARSSIAAIKSRWAAERHSRANFSSLYSITTL